MRARLAALLVSFLALLLAATVTLAGPAAAKRPAPKYPSSISALGDSITRGFNATWIGDQPQYSWSTGSAAIVDSHYLRLRDVSPSVRATNLARSGAVVSELPGQAAASVAGKNQYATILIGANDACADTLAGMTSVESFRASFTSAMGTFAQQRPQPAVLVASIPDLERLWLVGKDSSAARTAWDTFDTCQNMLANPTSTAETDVARRAAVSQRVDEYNAVLAEVCGTHSFCRYDGGAVHAYPFTLSQLSGWDYFHPNASGQAALAEVTWQAGFWPAQ